VKETHPAGAVRHKRDGEWVVTSPGDAMYSTAIMLAVEYWNIDRGEWVLIFEDGDHDD